ncbi:hypothetical protein OFC56_39705, partial [Escherichia coli]|nr:hypothetical protein [Escherichia coli]
IADFIKTRTPEEVEARIGEIRKLGAKKEHIVPTRDTTEYFGEFLQNKKKAETQVKKEEEEKEQALKNVMKKAQTPAAQA